MQPTNPLSPDPQDEQKKRLPCVILDLGLIKYGDALAVQRELVRLRKEKTIPDVLLLVEHPHVITLGRTGKPEHLLASAESLLKKGVEFFPTERGGDITYHGPGQLVVYPIFDLTRWHKDIHLFLRTLEECVIKVLGDFGISAGRIPGATGVWVGQKKIAALGVRTSQWVTSHGLAFNINSDIRFFDLIIPCGIRDKGVTSLDLILGCPQDMAVVKSRLTHHFLELFDRTQSPFVPIPETVLSLLQKHEENHAFQA